MLKEIRLMCESKADSRIKDLDWRKCNKNLLFDRYCDEEIRNPALADAFVAAILVRYWHTIGSNVRRGSGMCAADECLNWLVDSLMYTLQHKAWRDPTKTVYMDPDGPDKCLNLKLSCTRKVFYLYSNSKKRKDNYGNTISLEGLMEACGDSELSKLTDKTTIDMVTTTDPLIYSLVVDEFKHQNYLASFIIDGIVNADVFNTKNDTCGTHSEFSRNKLTRHINSIDKSYIKFFAKQYKLDEKEVDTAIESCKQLTSANIKKVLTNTFNKLKIILSE